MGEVKGTGEGEGQGEGEGEGRGTAEQEGDPADQNFGEEEDSAGEEAGKGAKEDAGDLVGGKTVEGGLFGNIFVFKHKIVQFLNFQLQEHSSHSSAHSSILQPEQPSSSSQTLPRARARASSSEGVPPTASGVPSARLSIEIVDPPGICLAEQVQSRRAPSTGRTPGFTTRRTQSIRRSRHWDDLRSIDIHG